MKKISITLSAVLLAGSLSAQMVSSTQIYMAEGVEVSIGQDFENNGELINDGEVHFRKGLTNNGSLDSKGMLVFDGFEKQTVSGTQSVELSNAILENNLDLNTTMVINNEMTYNEGVLKSSAANPLVYGANANHFGASDYSHSVGTVTKQSAANFEFPLGDGTNYRGFRARSINQNTLSADYIAQAPTKFSKELANGVEYLNESEYWVIKSDNENASANVELQGSFNNSVAYLKKAPRTGGAGTWTISENANFDKNNDIAKGVAFTSGSGKFIEKKIGVWPNPSRGDFNLKLTGMNDNDAITVDITNQDGRVVLNAKGKVSELRKVYTLPATMVTTELTLRVINGNEVLTEKLILNK